MHLQDHTAEQIRAHLSPALADRLEDPDAAEGIPRRHFMKMAAVTGFALGAVPLGADAQQAAAPAPPGIKPNQQPAAFVKIARNGTVTVTVNRLEFGQGAHTGLAMVLAEELDADWRRVEAVHGNADPAYNDPVFGMGITGNSIAMRHSYTQYRELGARTRAMLVAAAATRWGVPASSLATERGMVIGPGGRKLGYGALADAAMQQPVPSQVTLKEPSRFKLIGQPTTRLDAQAKSSGRQGFGLDVRLPGMLTAVLQHPPVFGSKVAALDDAAARAVPGVKAVMRVPLHDGGEGVAVVATGYWAAKQGRDALKMQWNDAGREKVDSERQLAGYRALAATTGHLQHEADMALLVTAPQKISAEFVFPYLAHAPMEPLNCTVQITGSGADAKAEVWTGTQMPGFDMAAAARTLGLKPEQVTMYVQMAGGGFGRRGLLASDFVVEACSIAKAAQAAGLIAPVRTVWSREDDLRGGYYRPMHVHRAEIGFDAQGKVLAWDHVIVGQSIMTGTVFERLMLKGGVDRSMVEGMGKPYTVPMRLSAHHPKLNVPVLWWRSVGSTHTAYVMETLIDEIARATNQDPVAYRMKLMDEKAGRHRAALQLAVDKSGYGKRELPAGRAWGVAVHESFHSVVAYVVEASVDNGTPKLHQVTAGVHCNLAVNPMSVEAQIQGGALMGLSMCLPGAAITLKDGVVEQSNFGDFAVPRITDMPTIAVHIVPSAEAPTGIGEPGVPPLAPAFANAIARLTGKPLRELPFKLA